MAGNITKPPVRPAAANAAIEQFIQGAPDAKAPKAGKGEEEGVQITLRMSKEQLERISAVAKRQGIPRASYIKRAVFIQLESDESK
jgi:predicted DNA binding CopG/RHH family protein